MRGNTSPVFVGTNEHNPLIGSVASESPVREVYRVAAFECFPIEGVPARTYQDTSAIAKSNANRLVLSPDCVIKVARAAPSIVIRELSQIHVPRLRLVRCFAAAIAFSFKFNWNIVGVRRDETVALWPSAFPMISVTRASGSPSCAAYRSTLTRSPLEAPSPRWHNKCGSHAATWKDPALPVSLKIESSAWRRVKPLNGIGGVVPSLDRDSRAKSCRLANAVVARLL